MQTEVSVKQILVMALSIQAVVAAVAWAGLYFSRIDVSWGIGSAPLYIALGITGALVSYWIARAITVSNSDFGATLRDHCKKLHLAFRHLNWWQIAVLALAAGVCEELLFRGFLQPWIASLFTPSAPIVGLVVASVVFGLLHYASFIYFLITAVMGLVLGLVYWLSESLLAVVVWHGVYDLIALGVLAKFPQRLGVYPDVVDKPR